MIRGAILLTFITAFLFGNTYAQKAAIKTNLLHWATGTPNAALEWGMTSQLTASLSVGYNALASLGQVSLRHLSIVPELKYWPCQRFERHFIGVHGSLGKFDLANLPFIPAFKERAYNGTFYGGGIIYGYHWPLGKRWGIEAKVGAGYLYIDYKKFACKTCDEFLKQEKVHYWGATSAAISVIYLLK